MKHINIIGTIFDNSMDHTIGYASQVYDENLEKKQDIINSELRRDINVALGKPQLDDAAAILQILDYVESIKNQDNNVEILQILDYINSIKNLLDSAVIIQQIFNYINLQDNTDEIQQILDYIENIKNLQNTSIILQILDDIEELKSQQTTRLDFIVLTQELYDALEEYEDILYFIIEPKDWGFGDEFPIVLGDSDWKFGDKFPIIF